MYCSAGHPVLNLHKQLQLARIASCVRAVVRAVPRGSAWETGRDVSVISLSRQDGNCRLGWSVQRPGRRLSPGVRKSPTSQDANGAGPEGRLGLAGMRAARSSFSLDRAGRAVGGPQNLPLSPRVCCSHCAACSLEHNDHGAPAPISISVSALRTLHLHLSLLSGDSCLLSSSLYCV
jgi:hypothetical protein